MINWFTRISYQGNGQDAPIRGTEVADHCDKEKRPMAQKHGEIISLRNQSRTHGGPSGLAASLAPKKTVTSLVFVPSTPRKTSCKKRGKHKQHY